MKLAVLLVPLVGLGPLSVAVLAQVVASPTGNELAPYTTGVPGQIALAKRQLSTDKRIVPISIDEMWTPEQQTKGRGTDEEVTQQAPRSGSPLLECLWSGYAR
jgi:hypothetical protein